MNGFFELNCQGLSFVSNTSTVIYVPLARKNESRTSLPEVQTFLTVPSDYQPARNAIDQMVRHPGTASQTKYNVRWYGYSAKSDTYELAWELWISFVQRYWTVRQRHKVPTSEQTGMVPIPQQG